MLATGVARRLPNTRNARANGVVASPRPEEIPT